MIDELCVPSTSSAARTRYPPTVKSTAASVSSMTTRVLSAWSFGGGTRLRQQVVPPSNEERSARRHLIKRRSKNASGYQDVECNGFLRAEHRGFIAVKVDESVDVLVVMALTSTASPSSDAQADDRLVDGGLRSSGASTVTNTGTSANHSSSRRQPEAPRRTGFLFNWRQRHTAAVVALQGIVELEVLTLHIEKAYTVNLDGQYRGGLRLRGVYIYLVGSSRPGPRAMMVLAPNLSFIFTLETLRTASASRFLLLNGAQGGTTPGG